MGRVAIHPVFAGTSVFWHLCLTPRCNLGWDASCPVLVFPRAGCM